MLIKNRAANYTFAGMTALIGLICLLLVIAPGNDAHPPTAGSRFGAGVGLILFGVMAFRALRMGVEVGAHTVTLRNFGSTKVISWDQVRQLTVVDSGNATGRATCVACVLVSGEVVRAMATASFRGAKVQAMAITLEHARPPHS